MTAPPPPTHPMTPVDRAWLRMDRPDNLMTVNCLMFLEDSLDHAGLVQLVENRLLPVPRFRQVPAAEGSGLGRRHVWRTVPEVDLSFHLEVHQLEPDGSTEDLERLVTQQMERPFPADRPPWRLFRIEGHGEHTVLFWQLQHSIGDGVALLVLLLSLTDLSSSADGANPLSQLFTRETIDPHEARRDLEAVMPQATRLMVRPVEAMAETSSWKLWVGGVFSFLRLSVLPPDRRSPFKGRMSGAKRVAWSREIPLDEIRRLRAQVDGTVTDVLLTILSGALRREALERGDEARDVRALVPVSLRPLDEMRDLGNRFGIVFLRLPLSIEEPVERLAELRRRMRRLKWSLQPLVTLVALGVIGRLPHWLQRLVLWIFGSKGTTVVSSVPGPVVPLCLAGRPIRDIVFWVPQSAGLSLGLSILTYEDRVALGVMSDAAVIDDPERIVRGFAEELEALQRAVGAPPIRTVPEVT